MTTAFTNCQTTSIATNTTNYAAPPPSPPTVKKLEVARANEGIARKIYELRTADDLTEAQLEIRFEAAAGRSGQ